MDTNIVKSRCGTIQLAFTAVLFLYGCSSTADSRLRESSDRAPTGSRSGGNQGEDSRDVNGRQIDVVKRKPAKDYTDPTWWDGTTDVDSLRGRPFLNIAYDGVQVDFLDDGLNYVVGYTNWGQRVDAWLWLWPKTGTEYRLEHYREGKLDGAYRRWEESGQLMEVGEYHCGVRNGLWLIWHSNKQLSFEQSFSNGEPHGRAAAWQKDGTPMWEASFDHGAQVGIAKAWHPNGRLWLCQSYSNGKLDGEHTQWFPDGTRREHGWYETGSPHGIWCEWDEDGALIREVKYEHGVLKK